MRIIPGIRHLSALLALTFASTSVEAQTKDSIPNPTTLVQINPLALLDFLGGLSVRLGVEHEISPSLSLAFEGGYAYACAGFDTYSGHLFRAEATYWLRNSAAYAQGFSFDAAYKYGKGSCTDTIEPRDQEHYLKSYTLEKTVFTARICFVERHHWTGRFYTETFVGLGVRVKEARCSDLIMAESDARDLGEGFIINFTKECGDAVYPDVIAGLRVGFRLK